MGAYAECVKFKRLMSMGKTIGGIDELVARDCGSHAAAAAIFEANNLLDDAWRTAWGTRSLPRG